MIGFLTDVLASGVRISSPIALAGIGETYSERAGVINIGLEGYMLAGALAGVLGSRASGSAVVGLLAALAAGLLLALIHAFVTVTLRGDQIVSGIAINLFALGATIFLYDLLLGDHPEEAVAGFQSLRIPGLADIPVVGRALFEQTIIVYALYVLVAVAGVVLFRTSWGLDVRAAGENPLALDAAGSSVPAVRYQCILLAGALAGLGGGYLSLSQLRFFVVNVTGGRGFIALAAVIFGNWSPVKVALAAGLFGTVDALQLRLQAAGVPIPAEAITMLPYLFSIVVLASVTGRSRMPTQLGRPYIREEA
jgi:simple sugar transport system permease protein